MVSRRKILSRSRDDLNQEQPALQEEEEDVWYQKDKLYKVSPDTSTSKMARLSRSICGAAAAADQGVDQARTAGAAYSSI